MTKTAAYRNFWRSFGLEAYEENSVPSGDAKPEFPYITYQVSTDSIGAPVVLNASIWDRSTSWSRVYAATENISKAIGRGGKMIPYDGGAIWIHRGSPFAQNMGDPSDDMIKRKVLNISAEFLSAD